MITTVTYVRSVAGTQARHAVSILAQPPWSGERGRQTQVLTSEAEWDTRADWADPMATTRLNVGRTCPTEDEQSCKMQKYECVLLVRI